MAKDTEVNIRFKGTDDTSEAASEAVKNIQKVGKAGKTAAKGTKKDWGGVLDLFTSFLPRGLQRTIRQFKSSSRAVGRLSKSFKFLKLSIAALGLPALLILLEYLIANWQKITDALGFTSEANRQAAADFKELSGALAEVNNQATAYLDILYTIGEEQSVIQGTLKKLNQEFGNAIDLEADLNTQKEQALALVTKKATLDEINIRLKQQENKLNEKSARILELRNKNEREGLTTAEIQEFNKLKEETARIEQKIVDFKISQIKAEDDLNKVIKENTDRIKERDEAARKAEKARLDAIRKRQEIEAMAEKQRKKDLEFVQMTLIEQVEAQRTQAMEKLAKDEDDLARKQLHKRQTDLEIEFIERGALEEEMVQLRKNNAIELEAFELDVLNRKLQREQDEIDRIKHQQEQLRSELFQAGLTAEEKEDEAIRARYVKRMEMANGNRDLERQAKEQFDKEMLALTEKNEAKILKAQTDAKKKLVGETRNLLGQLESMAEEGSAKQKALAVTDVLLAQAVSIAEAIKGANKAASASGPAAPLLQAAYMISMVGSVVAGFANIKNILQEAGASSGGGGIGTGGSSPTRPLIPENVARTETISDPIRTFVVASELEGANLASSYLDKQTTLG